jgi:eukaryotic-like serine/threonine-protein kinase
MKPLSATDPPLIGDFRLSARLGSGGMGQVYLGFSPAGRAVAVKVVHSHLADDPQFLDRFRHEVEAASKVSGIYAAAVVASGVTDSPPWLATAYVPGPSLAVLVDSYGPLPEDATWRLAAGLAEALRNVHDAGLVHRDLKPPNVLIADDGPHVIDFGISRAFEGTHLTSAGMLIGTPGYMSPEQVEGQQAGPASDVFALGCVIAYAATGKPPFGTGSNPSILYRVAFEEPDLGQVSPDLRHVIQACLKKTPAQRTGLIELANMIASAGPPAQATLGSFWPEPVASQIVAARSSTTPETQAQDGRVPNEVATPASGTDSGPTSHDPVLPDGIHTHERPPASAVPRTVRDAVRLMCLGFVVTLADLILSLMVLGRYNNEVTLAQQASLAQAERTANHMAGAMAIGVAADFVGLAGWAWLAVACRRGAGWPRAAGTALLVIYSVCTLVIVLATHGDPGPRFATIAVWVTGLAATVLLWSSSASAFFARWRKR